MFETRDYWKTPPPDIGGWLITSLLGLAWTVFELLRALVVDILPNFEAAQWQRLTSPGSFLYSRYWAPYFIASSALSIGLACFALVLVVMFTKRKRRLPSLIRIFYGLAILTAAFEATSTYLLSKELPMVFEMEGVTDTYLACARDMVFGVGWIWYFGMSKRVAATFLN